MDPALVFAKTAKGREEIDKRTHKLESRRRMLLIVVDGETTAQALAQKTAHADDGLAILQGLWSEGFIEPAGVFAGAPVDETPHVAEPKHSTGRTLDELQHAASHAIENLLGPEGETMALRLERTHSIAEFLAEAQRIRESMKQIAGAKKSDAFWAALKL